MKRRDFIRTTALGTAFVSTAGAYFYSCKNNANDTHHKGTINCYKNALDIPVIQNVDVLVIGGSSAGVSAASAVSKAGGNAFLVAEEPYLGVDICGTYRYWADKEKMTHSLAQRMFDCEGIPTPLHVKKTLDDELIDNGVGFFYSSYIYDVLVDEQGNVAGAIIANRSGLQAIFSNVVIDATLYAGPSRIAGINFEPFKKQTIDFEFTVLGNEKKEGEGIVSEELPGEIKIGDNEYKALKYTYSAKLNKIALDELAEVEQTIRSITWDPSQVDSADMVFFLSPESIISKNASKNKTLDLSDFPTDSFIPEKLNGWFVMNGYAQISVNQKKQLFEHQNYISAGELVGTRAFTEAAARTKASDVTALANHSKIKVKGEIGITWDFERQSVVKGSITEAKHELPVFGNYDVLVMGGGTAGAPAAISAAQNGANTLLIEYLHGLGGLMTLGLIGRYFHGYREGYTKIVDKGVNEMGPNDHPRYRNKHAHWLSDWKMEYFRKELLNAGGKIWFGCIGIGAVIEGNTVKGVVVATPFGKGVVLAKNVIDSTGSADIAIAAGAKFKYTGKDCVAVQGAGLPPINVGSYNNTDWTFINDSDIYDIWRTFVMAKIKYKDDYDIGKLLQTRERRRIIGDYEVQVLDVYNERRYPDIISLHKSSFDTHGYIIDPFFILKTPTDAHTDVYANVPFRALLPKGIEGIAATGLGASAHRDAMPVIRMQPCLQNQGYAIGYAAAIAAEEGIPIRQVDLKKVQQRAVDMGSLPESVLTDKDTFPPNEKDIIAAIEDVKNDQKNLEMLLWQPEKSVPMMKEAMKNEEKHEDKLVYARILAFLGVKDGKNILLEAVKDTAGWDKGWDYRGMGQFGMSNSYFDSLVMAVGLTCGEEAVPVIAQKASLLLTDSEFSHFRAVAEAFENIGSKKAAGILYQLLNLPGMQGHYMTSVEEAKELVQPSRTDTSTRNKSLKELFLARSLNLCGDKNELGEEIMKKYASDLRGHYARHASQVLKGVR
ncbi:MAG: FAD-dependent oxidoreductase [Bacteroidota bacterium]